MTRAAKAKGRTGQNEIRDKLLETFPEFEEDDIKSTTMGDTGEDMISIDHYMELIRTWK